MDDDGTLDEDALLALAPPDLKALMEPVVRKCGTKGNFRIENGYFLKLLTLFF